MAVQTFIHDASNIHAHVFGSCQAVGGNGRFMAKRVIEAGGGKEAKAQGFEKIYRYKKYGELTQGEAATLGLHKTKDRIGKREKEESRGKADRGFLVFLLLILFEKTMQITKADYFSFFFAAYHIGIGITVISMFTRGIVTILEQKGTIVLSSGLDASISGISGLGHFALAIALVILMNILKQRMKLGLIKGTMED